MKNGDDEEMNRWSNYHSNSKRLSGGSHDTENQKDSNDESLVVEAIRTGQSRVLLDGKGGRKAVTAYLNQEVKYEISRLHTRLKREFTPEPRKLDVYAAVFYAGLPQTSRSMRDFLREFGYREK